MSYNLVDPTTGDLTRVAGNSNIVDTAIEIDSTWSSKKISADLADKQDFRIFNSLEEFNEKKGTSLTVVSGIDNMKDIANAMSSGEILIITVKYELGSEVYFGLTISTGWTKMFTFIKSNRLCDVECRTTFPLTIKRVLNSDGVIGDWQQLATENDLNSKGVFKGYIVPNKKLTISMDPYSEVYGYIQVQGNASIPFRLHNAALNATPTVFLKISVTINEENVYVDKPFGTTASIGPVTIANTNGVWTITNASTETESYWVGGGVNSVTLSDV